MKTSRKPVIIRNVLVIYAILTSVVSGQTDRMPSTQAEEPIRAREATYQELLRSIKPRPGQDEQPAQVAPRLLHRTNDGYIRFLLMPRSSHIEVAKPQDWRPENVADAFVVQWKGLLTSESDAMQFTGTRLVQRRAYTIVTYGQRFGGLDVHGATIIVQVNKAGGIDALNSDVMRDSSVLESNQVSLQPTIDSVAAGNRAVSWMSADWKARYQRDIDLKFSASPGKLMIFAPSVVQEEGSPRMVWQFEIRSALGPIREYVLLEFRGQLMYFDPELSVAVGTALAGGPPHRSVREALPHTALTSGR